MADPEVWQGGFTVVEQSENSATTPPFRNPSLELYNIRVLISHAREHSMIVGGANDLRREAFSSYGTSPRRFFSALPAIFPSDG